MVDKMKKKEKNLQKDHGQLQKSVNLGLQQRFFFLPTHYSVKQL